MITTDFFTQYPVSINFKINSFKSGRVFCNCSKIGICNNGLFLEFHKFETKYLAGVYKRH